MPSKKRNASNQGSATPADHTSVGVMSYNVGFQTSEIGKPNWHKPHGKLERFRRDVEKAFDYEYSCGIQILLISEFGNMDNKVTATHAGDIMTGIVDALEI